jgi:hypothetical protein
MVNESEMSCEQLPRLPVRAEARHDRRTRRSGWSALKRGHPSVLTSSITFASVTRVASTQARARFVNPPKRHDGRIERAIASVNWSQATSYLCESSRRKDLRE